MSKHARENNRGSVQDKRNALQYGRGPVQSGRGSVQNGRAPVQRGRVPAQASRASVKNGSQPAKRPSVNNTPYQGTGDLLKKNVVYIVAVVATVLVFVAGFFVVRALLSDDNQEVAEQGYVSPYDWTKLDRTNDHYQYVVNGQVKSRLGIDVSSHQGQINWYSVVADGVDFAYVRVGYRGATEGDLYLDEMFRTNLDGAHNAGLDCGVYFFSQAQTTAEAVEEAEYVLSSLKGTKLEYPVAFDTEATVLNLETTRTTGLSPDEMTAIANAFCERIEREGYSTIIYGSARDLARLNCAGLQGRPIWWARYGTSEPQENVDISMWQYSESGQVDGIEGGVDMNIDLANALS